MTTDIDLRCCDAGELLASLPDGGASLVMLDAPWSYSDGGFDRRRGNAKTHYKLSSEEAIVDHAIAAYRVAGEDAWLAVWCTGPKSRDWFWASEFAGLRKLWEWEYKTMMLWFKTNGSGIGYHLRGVAEMVYLYTKGKPPVREGHRPNFWLTPEVDCYQTRRKEHSEKPAIVLRSLLELATAPGDLVLDVYAGASASLALACRSMGRRYVGAELSAERHSLALLRLSQQEMTLSTAPGGIDASCLHSEAAHD